MAKKRDPDDEKDRAKLLDGLRRAMDGMPRRLRISGKNPGLFPIARSSDTVAKQALDDGFLRQVSIPEGAPRPAARSRPPIYVCITEKGQQFVLDQDDPIRLLKELSQGVERMYRELQPQFAQYSGTVQAIQTAIQELARRPNSSQPVGGPQVASPAWLEEVIRFVSEEKRKNSFDRPSLPRVYDHLKTRWPGLTLGQFHDGIRQLHEQKRIRLAPYTLALATLDEVRNALYLDREVKYYVDVP